MTTRSRPLLWPAACLALVAAAALLSVMFGARTVSPGDAFAALVHGEDGTLARAAVRQRVPRTGLALLVGAALGTAGAVMQSLTRNPLADPGILGVNAGAALAVVCGIAYLGISTPAQYMWLAVAGAGAAALLVYAIGSRGRGGATPVKLALVGTMVTAALSSLVSAVLLPRLDVVNTFRFWQIGGVGGASADGIRQVLPLLAAGFLLSLGSARGLNALALGDDLATGLGQHVARTRLLAALGAVLLCGAATAAAGPIGFVGLVVPHTVRLLTGPDNRRVLPLSALAGAALVTLADVAGRLVARPGDMEVGIVTAVVGAPVFIAVARRQKVRDL
ncbi:FecCD family ABC transporter permease [Streptomyces sp. CA-249302]|uniref:FecCD family ABC transporter permease n=1 Tax=Streptomyces sp. CA-249302 TaxID=3240058 RepID=UPI003D945172